MKNIRIISILVFSVLLFSCGYKPAKQMNMNMINIQDINITGEKKIIFRLKNNILLVSNNNSSNKYDIGIKVTKKKIAKIKDTSGKVTRYDLSLSTNLKLINLNNKTEITKIFFVNESFDVAKNHSDTIANEKNITNNIIQQLSEDIITFITAVMRNK